MPSLYLVKLTAWLRWRRWCCLVPASARGLLQENLWFVSGASSPKLYPDCDVRPHHTSKPQLLTILMLCCKRTCLIKIQTIKSRVKTSRPICSRVLQFLTFKQLSCTCMAEALQSCLKFFVSHSDRSM